MKFRYRGLQCFSPGIDDNGPLGAQLVQMEADGLADAPFNPVAHNGLADRARQGEADTRS